MRRKIRLFLMIVLAAVFCVSAAQLILYWHSASQEEKAFEMLAEQVAGAGRRPLQGADASGSPQGAGASNGPQGAGGSQGTGLSGAGQDTASEGAGSDPAGTAAAVLSPEEILAGYAALREKNPDMFGWVCIDGTRLNYPVMHTPEDPEYYLHRAFDGSSAQSGVPFLDASCYEGCGNYMVYGHKMKSGSMFAMLLSYDERAFWKQHPVIWFDTPEELGEYEVMAAFYSEIYPQDQMGVFRYYQYTDVTDEAVFEEYVSQVKAASLYDTGVQAEYGDTLLTLSTCSYHKDNGRFVVVARKAADKADDAG